MTKKIKPIICGMFFFVTWYDLKMINIDENYP
jgi:hypothetical protein